MITAWLWLTFASIGPCEPNYRPRVRVVRHQLIVDWAP